MWWLGSGQVYLDLVDAKCMGTSEGHSSQGSNNSSCHWYRAKGSSNLAHSFYTKCLKVGSVVTLLYQQRPDITQLERAAAGVRSQVLPTSSLQAQPPHLAS